MSKEIDVPELDFLLRFNIDHTYVSPLDFLSNSAWSAIKVHACTHIQDFLKINKNFVLVNIDQYCQSPPALPYLCPGDEFHR